MTSLDSIDRWHRHSLKGVPGHSGQHSVGFCLICGDCDIFAMPILSTCMTKAVVERHTTTMLPKDSAPSRISQKRMRVEVARVVHRLQRLAAEEEHMRL